MGRELKDQVVRERDIDKTARIKGHVKGCREM